MQLSVGSNPFRENCCISPWDCESHPDQPWIIELNWSAQA
ncbi:hypothetical protein SynBOUM118_01376 [Synechococcus sp. BOUM118]|nr:hypothetical protein SynBOUM118_01376 [Synechococcus sp. BOUM118]